jgi:hypothetical protein
MDPQAPLGYYPSTPMHEAASHLDSVSLHSEAFSIYQIVNDEV